MTKDPKILYQRELPGGGYVNVEEDEAARNAEKLGVHVKVERRTDPVRRDGHEPPVIARAEGTSAPGIFHELIELAQDNVAIAKALLRLRGDGKARF
jgi:hypothetical protein